ncbi:FAS-associated factor 1 [Diabrotica virgifera virgifera]|uniref:UBX domain-containing protein n=1 Tax=Diabrotica virgifera virgifera TaxID=50390 RepID=A0ABM5KU82_DIAVI|nr:FAS-associated factor 1 [Diabrotica virgifera virgifera]
MSENREEILADFQACTGIEDVAEAIYHLDEANWDLLRAVSRVMPPDTQSFRPPAVEPVDPDVMIVEDDADIPSAATADAASDMVVVGNSLGHSSTVTKKANTPDDSFPSTSAGKSGSRMLKFNVQYCDRVVKVELPESATVNDLKLKLHREVKVNPCRQLLSSWARLAQYEDTPFSKLMLPGDNSLHLTVKPSDGAFTSDEENAVSEKLRGTYTLNVKYENKTFNLKYQGTKTILEVKGDVYTLTNIHVRNQVWSGWPPNIDDNTVLALSGINYPEHDLSVRRSTQSVREKKSMPVVQIDSDDDEFEDASESFTVDDEYFVDNEGANAKRTDPLIPEDVEDEIVGCITFAEQFTTRYGPVHPAFYQGTLDDAIKEACSKPAKDRKILAIYLHHDASVLTNVFCTQLLGFESVMQMFENNFVLWGWDITFESNRRRLQQSVTTSLGATAAMSLRNIPVDRLPVIILITKIRSTIEIFSVVYGNVGVNELLSSLIECVEVFLEHQRVEIKEEEERAEREMVKLEQDLAYRESLEADRAKEEAKRLQEKKETETRKRLESEKALSEAKKEAFRKQVEADLPPEPSLEQGDSITKIRFRLPKGEHLERRFQTTTPLKVLLDFLIVKGYPTEEFKVISSWPRRDLTSLDKSQTLKELKLYPQETVILEER